MDYSKPMSSVPKSPPPSAPPPHGGQHTPAVGTPVTPPSNVQLPPPAAYSGVPGPWSTGLCDCFSDVPNCCITFWCPCITFGQIVDIIDRGSTSCGASGALYTLIAFNIGCPCVYSCFYRTKMRRQYMLPESPCGDCLVQFCCEGCVLCQEYRELKHRGFDMCVGWKGNVKKQTQGVRMAPVVEGAMSR